MTPTYEYLKLWFTPAREARFWRKVDKRADGCWVWTGSLTESGHGRYDIDGAVTRVHRLTWILARERDIPEMVIWKGELKPLVIRHLMCDNEACCNPAHLVGGAQGENVADIWLLHKRFDEAMEQEAIAAYQVTPFVGYFSGESWAASA